MASPRLKQLLDTLRARAIRGHRGLVIDENTRGLDELGPTLGLLPGAELALSQVVVEASDTILTLSGRWEAAGATLPGFTGIELGEITLEVIIDASAIELAPRVTASFSGALSTPAGTWQVRATADYPDGWRVSVASETVSLASALALVPAVDLDAWLPPPLRPLLAGARLSALELRVAFGVNYRVGVALTVGCGVAWELIPGRLSIQDTKLDLALGLDQHGLATMAAALRGSTTLAGHTYLVAVGLDAGAALSVGIEPAQNQPPLGIANVAALLGSSELGSLESTLAQLGIRGLELGRLALIVQLPTLAIVRAQVEVQMVLRDLALVGHLRYPELSIGAGLAPDSQLDLSGLARSVWPELPDLGPLALTAAQIEIAPAARTLRLAASLLGDWGIDVGKTRLALEQAKLDLVGSPSSLAGTLHFETRLGECRAIASLVLPERELGLRLAEGSTLDLHALLASFAPDDLVLPAELEALTKAVISKVALGFNFATGRYELRGEVRLDQLTLGELTLKTLTGKLELVGVGASLERLVIEFGAQCEQDLVPGLAVHELELELALTRERAKPLAWKIGGAIALTLFDLPRQRLHAELSGRAWHFSASFAEPLVWSLPDVLELSFERLALTLEREGGATRWALEAKGGLGLVGLAQLRGTLGLEVSALQKGFAFNADPEQAALRFSLPLVPGEERLTLAGSVGLTRLSLFDRGGWELAAAASFTPSFPPAPPLDAGPLDPLDQTLRFLHELVAVEGAMSATLAASRSGASLRVAGWPSLSLPFPVVLDGELAWARNSKVRLDALELRLGRTLSGSAKLRLDFPPEINNVFGEDHGQAKVAVLNSGFVLALSLDQKTGVALELDSLPINLDDTGPFKAEQEGERTWTRFSLADVSFRFGSFADDQGRNWLHIDLHEQGEVRLSTPRLSFNGVDFFGSGGLEIIRPLRIPTTPLRWILAQIGADELLALLPSHLEPLDIHVLDADDRFDADAFVDILSALTKTLSLALPVEDLRAPMRELAGRFNRLPAGLRDYLDITIPRRLEMSLALTPGTGFGVKLDISAPDDPLKFVWPTTMGINGVKLRKLAFGEILSGNLLLLEVDLEADVFDFVSLALALAAPPELVAPIVDTRAIQRTFIVRNLLCLIVYQTQIPIPIPIWLDELGVRHHGPEGLRAQLSVINTLSEFSFSKLVRGLAKLYTELKGFFIEPERRLPATLFSQAGINLGVRVEPGFVQLPNYLGASVLGREDKLLELSADSLLIPIVNFLKHPRLDDLLAPIPLDLRSGGLAGTQPVRIGPIELQAVWLLASAHEFDQLIRERASTPNAFVEHLYASEASGDEFVATLRALASNEAAEQREGVVIYLAGGAALPVADSTIEGMAGMLFDPGRGLVTEFRVAGQVGPVLDLDLRGRLAIVDALLVAEGKVRLVVLGHLGLEAAIALDADVFSFEGAISLFPPGSGLQADAQVKGRISKSELDVVGTATVSLPLLPATTAALSLSYTRAALALDWLDQRWVLELSRSEGGRTRLDARAERALVLLPALVRDEPALLTLTGALDEPESGPWLRLEGPDAPTLRLQGALALPRLSATGAGDVQITATRVQAIARVTLHGFGSQLALDGVAIDQPASFTYQARFEADLFQALAKGMHDAFDALVASAREGVEKAKQVFDVAWAQFKVLVTQLAQEVRAWLLQTKDNLERELRKLLDSVGKLLEDLKTNADEIATRTKQIDDASAGLQQTVEFFEAQFRNARSNIENNDQQIRELEDWYYRRLDDTGRFFNAVYFGLEWLRLTSERKILPSLLFAAENELARARAGLANAAVDLKKALATLDQLRNGLLGQLLSAQQAVLDKKGVLDQINDQLRLSDEALALLGQQFGKFVDDTMLVIARRSYDLALGVLAGFDAASQAFITINRSMLPFEVTRLTVAGSLLAHTGARFEAKADVWLNVFEQPRLVENLGVDLDFDNLAETTLTLGWRLWDQRNQLEYVDQTELRRRVEQEFQALAAIHDRLGDDFGESLDRKLLYEMDWIELVKFYDHREQLETRYPIIQRAATLIETHVPNLGAAVGACYTPQPYLHEVQSGEALGGLAQRYYGNFDDYTHIFNANRDILSDPNLIYGGQRLRIPGWRILEVRGGDMLGDIAQRIYGDFNAYVRIFDANRDILSDPNLIYAGQRLRLPGHWQQPLGDMQMDAQMDAQSSALADLRAREREFKARFAG